ncbi:anaphase-promoting complex, subunit 10-domain-containing protein [Flagelloscypha sp. PMI_526]|nr:anaphase-promoting complex, subunit 10-domain-containing protein [Flagelloscypha sp. PMI_526]
MSEPEQHPAGYLVYPHHVDWSTVPYPDISSRGKWSVSSAKFGFGTECLRDDDLDTFWHSDGPQPHYITVEFPQKVAIQQVAFQLSFPQDDSYTPNTIELRAGTGVNDLQPILYRQFEKPDGWLLMDLNAEMMEDGETHMPLHAYVLQLMVVTNYMSGKDTHVRGMKVLGPKEEAKPDDGSDPFPFEHSSYRLYQTLR